MENEYIYWEQQDSDMLCAVNALNSLLQGPHWNAVSLATISQELDTEENQLLSGSQQFDAGANVGESGYFSVQALQRALTAYGLECDYYNSEMKRGNDPVNEKAFICNRLDHWYSLRKIKDTWWNLNSLNEQPGPQRVGEFYLSALLHNIQSEGYTIFVVRGELPESNKDFWPDLGENQFWIPRSLLEPEQRAPNPDEDIAKAIEMSLKESENQMDPDLYWAVQESLRAEEARVLQEQVQKNAVELKQIPEYEGENAFTIRLRLPDGKFETKNFLPECKLSDVINWGKFITKREVQLVETFPRNVLNELDKTLQEAGYGPSNNALILEYLTN
ncbi:unnamed protein product [Blepharisma stoltei]|uniref:ubiquitinyl hydrolase 1 n=1 Tax=Blepharisma stoltei TaxID=1481888 RepID=A0AAU9JQ66_9CILI|nr:unnamed protein product [Blepharisma stoltei]